MEEATTAPSSDAEGEVPAKGEPTKEKEEKIVRKSGNSSFKLLAIGIVVIVVVAAVAAAYVYETLGSKSSTGCSNQVILDGAGSTFVAPLMDKWTTSYANATVNYDSVGSGTGIQDLQALAVQFAASDAPPNYAQQSGFEHPWLTMPEAAGAVVVIYNVAGLSTPLRTNGTWLSLVFMGSITNWNDSMLQALNPGVPLPNQQIVTVHRSDGSGTSYVFQQYLSQENGYWGSKIGYSTTWLGPGVPGEVAADGSSGVAEAVESIPWAISYVDLTYATQNSLTYAALKNPSGDFVVPNEADTASAISDVLSQPGFKLPPGNGNWTGVNVLNAPGPGDYPMATFTYLLFYDAPDQVWLQHLPESLFEILENFLSWILHIGQSYSAGLDYVPLPYEVIGVDEKTLPLMTWGGSSVPSC